MDVLSDPMADDLQAQEISNAKVELIHNQRSIWFPLWLEVLCWSSARRRTTPSHPFWSYCHKEVIHLGQQKTKPSTTGPTSHLRRPKIAKDSLCRRTHRNRISSGLVNDNKRPNQTATFQNLTETAHTIAHLQYLELPLKICAQYRTDPIEAMVHGSISYTRR